MMQPNTKELQRQEPLQYNYITQGEEISLVDIWISMRRYKKRFMYVFISLFLVGAVFVYFIYSKSFSLVSTIQVGTREVDNALVPVESPESLLSKINNSIIPVYTNKWIQSHSDRVITETMVSNPRDTNIIIITNKTNKDNIDYISDFQKGLVKIVIDGHQGIVNSQKSHIVSELRLAQLELEKLNNPLTLDLKLKEVRIGLDEALIKLKKIEDEQYFGIKKSEFQAEILQARHEKKRLIDLEKAFLEQFNRIEESKKILLENISELKAEISDATKNRRAAAASATEQSAMSQLLLGNEIQQNQNRLATLEERYFIQLENDKTELMQKIETARLQKIEFEKKIDLLEEKYKAMLADNTIMRDQQKLKVEKIEMEIEQIKLKQKNLIAMQGEKVREITTRLDNFSETRAVSTATQSLKPSGLSRFQMILMAFVGAMFAGFLAVLFAMFGDKVKEQLNEESKASKI